MPRREFRPSEVSAGGVVVRTAAAGHEVCLVSDGRHWGLPKGNVEPGETPQDAALREIHEETGLPREGLRLSGDLPPSDYVYRRGGRLVFKRVHQFLVEAPADAALFPDPHEIAACGWYSFTHARERASFDDTRRALDAALRLLDPGASVDRQRA